jgi:hypothetical protein
VRIEYHTVEAKLDSVKTLSNALGYVFVPFQAVALSPEKTWVVVAGYRSARIDFAAMRRKTKLVPQ